MPSSESLVSLNAVISMQYQTSSFVIRVVFILGLEVMSLSSNVWTFQAPRMSHLFFDVFFAVLVQLLVGWFASHGKLVRCGRAGYLWDTFSKPFPHVRVGSAVLKRAAKCLLCLGCEDRQPLIQGPPMCRFMTMTASDHLHLSPCHACITAGLGGRRKNADWQIGCTDKTCTWNFLKWGSPCSGTIQLSQTQKSRSSGMISHHDWRLCWLQWMARSSLMLQYCNDSHNKCILGQESCPYVNKRNNFPEAILVQQSPNLHSGSINCAFRSITCTIILFKLFKIHLVQLD